MVLADPLKCEDVVDSIDVTSSPSLALNAMASIALDDSAPPVGPLTPELPAPGDAIGEVTLTVSPVTMDDRYFLPAPLRDCDPPATG